MNKIILFTLLISLVLTNKAMAIDPVYEGGNGIKTLIFETNCNVCHSSTLSGDDRNDAPFKYNYDNYAAAVKGCDEAVKQAVGIMDMPPTFNDIRKLTDEQKQALTNWQQLDFPEKYIPTVFIEGETTLSIPRVYVMNSDGDVYTKVSAKLKLIDAQVPFRFEVSELGIVENNKESE